jgi:hypothetical protein
MKFKMAAMAGLNLTLDPKVEDFTQFWVFLYGCPVLTNDAG